MNFTHDELARMNEMMSVALLTGKTPMDEVSESLHKKITDELAREEESVDYLFAEEE